jgi:PEP-CTERM motif-containing protein
MKTTYVAALGAAMIATLGISSAAEAAVIDFGVAAIGGSPGVSYTSGSTLDQSSSFSLDGALLAVTSIGPGDASGLSIFPSASADTVTILPSTIDYGTGSGTVNTPLLGGSITKSWTANGDTFTELLDDVVSIDRHSLDAITVTLEGTLSDTSDIFPAGSPAFLILSATQSAGPTGAISVSLTNTSTLSGGTPEPSTWVMMALGFGALGYAATRKSKGKIAALSA